MLRNRRLDIKGILTILPIALIVCSSVHSEPMSQAKPVTASYVIDFAGYKGGSVDEWLKTRNYTFERGAKNRNLLDLSIAHDVLTLEAKGHMSGFILNDSVNVEKARTVRVNWGVKHYPQGISYQNKVNNEALMLYIFSARRKFPAATS